MLQRAQAWIHQLGTYRLFETLSSGITTIVSRYAFQVPDHLQSTVNDVRTVWVGQTRHTRQHPGGPGRRSRDPPGPGPHLRLGRLPAPASPPGSWAASGSTARRTTIVSFLGSQPRLAVWFQLWIDREGLVRRAHMRTIGHFMNDRYYDFDAPFKIQAPVR